MFSSGRARLGAQDSFKTPDAPLIPDPTPPEGESNVPPVYATLPGPIHGDGPEDPAPDGNGDNGYSSDPESPTYTPPAPEVGAPDDDTVSFEKVTSSRPHSRMWMAAASNKAAMSGNLKEWFEVDLGLAAVRGFASDVRDDLVVITDAGIYGFTDPHGPHETSLEIAGLTSIDAGSDTFAAAGGQTVVWGFPDVGFTSYQVAGLTGSIRAIRKTGYTWSLVVEEAGKSKILVTEDISSNEWTSYEPASDGQIMDVAGALTEQGAVSGLPILSLNEDITIEGRYVRNYARTASGRQLDLHVYGGSTAGLWAANGGDGWRNFRMIYNDTEETYPGPVVIWFVDVDAGTEAVSIPPEQVLEVLEVEGMNTTWRIGSAGNVALMGGPNGQNVYAVLMASGEFDAYFDLTKSSVGVSPPATFTGTEVGDPTVELPSDGPGLREHAGHLVAVTDAGELLTSENMVDWQTPRQVPGAFTSAIFDGNQTYLIGGAFPMFSYDAGRSFGDVPPVTTLAAPMRRIVRQGYQTIALAAEQVLSADVVSFATGVRAELAFETRDVVTVTPPTGLTETEVVEDSYSGPLSGAPEWVRFTHYNILQNPDGVYLSRASSLDGITKSIGRRVV